MTGKGLLAIACIAFAGITFSLTLIGPSVSKADAPALVAEPLRADLVEVDKSDREMRLLRGGGVFRTYSISLGFAPQGDKQREGDGKTPEGRYTITYRNPDSRFHLSLHIDYPNAQDRAEAAARGDDPGGEIFIHGGPQRGIPDALWHGRDWTLGCIAVTNAQIEEIWSLVPNGTPIEIRP